MMTFKQKRKLIDKWISRNGACQIDLKDKNIILYDGGLFSIEKKIKYHSRTRMKDIKEGKYAGCVEIKEIRGSKVKYEDYEAILWISELRETINYLRRLERLLKKMGYRTNMSTVKMLKEVKC